MNIICQIYGRFDSDNWMEMQRWRPDATASCKLQIDNVWYVTYMANNIWKECSISKMAECEISSYCFAVQILKVPARSLCVKWNITVKNRRYARHWVHCECEENWRPVTMWCRITEINIDAIWWNNTEFLRQS